MLSLERISVLPVNNHLLLGLDIGTSGCKAVVFDDQGAQIVKFSRDYSLIFPRAGWMELNPGLVAESAFYCLRQCVGYCGADEITALAVSSQGEAIIPVSADGKPLSNAIVTFDNRNVPEHRQFSEEFEKKQIMEITGAPIHTMFSLLKILWIKNNQPDIFANTWKFMCFGDYISFLLGSSPAIDYSMASRTMAFDIGKKEWSSMILGRCGVPLEKMPEVVPSGAVIGQVGESASASTGLSRSTKIVSGGHDQVCCALGAGILESGIAMDSLGTTESILCVNSQMHVTDHMIRSNLPCYCYPVNDLYAYLGFLSSSGAILKWYVNELLGGEKKSYSQWDAETAELCPGYSGLLLLPHFAGSGTPYLDFNSQGVLSGLTLGTTKYQIYKGILEGVCLEARVNIECMEGSGISIRELHCVGGGAKSSLWLQLKADITGKIVVGSDIDEFGCLGAAILAGIGAGHYPNANYALKNFKTVKKTYVPDFNKKSEYDAIYQEYSRMYQTDNH